MAARTGLSLLIFLLLLTFNCKEKEEPYLKDNVSHFVLYTDSSSGCFSCATTALNMLKDYVHPGKNLEIYLTKSKDNERFKLHLRDSFKERRLSFYEINLKVPHPSILLIKGRSVYMFFYIPNDPFLLEETMSLGRDFFLSQDRLPSEQGVVRARTAPCLLFVNLYRYLNL
jgi:hypothetical protein